MDSETGALLSFRAVSPWGEHVWRDGCDHLAVFEPGDRWAWIADRFGRELYMLDQEAAIDAIAFSPTEPIFALPNMRNGIPVVELRNVEDGHLQAVSKLGYPLNTLAFSSNGEWLWAALNSGDLVGCRVTQGFDLPTKVLDTGLTTSATDIAISRSGSLLATAHPESRIRIWSTGSNTLISELSHTLPIPNEMHFSPDERCLIWLAERKLSVWSLTTDRLHGTIESTAAFKLVFSPDDRRLALGGDSDGSNPRVVIWDLDRE